MTLQFDILFADWDTLSVIRTHLNERHSVKLKLITKKHDVSSASIVTGIAHTPSEYSVSYIIYVCE